MGLKPHLRVVVRGAEVFSMDNYVDTERGWEPIWKRVAAAFGIQKPHTEESSKFAFAVGNRLKTFAAADFLCL